MIDLLELDTFLHARIAGEMNAAEDGGTWRVDNADYPESILDQDGVHIVAGSRWGGGAGVFDSRSAALHIARWSPTRVTANCEARSRTVGLLMELDDLAEERWGLRPLIEQALIALAQPYRDHPDFNPEWQVRE